MIFNAAFRVTDIFNIGLRVWFTDTLQVNIIIIKTPIQLWVQVKVNINAASQPVPKSQRQTEAQLPRKTKLNAMQTAELTPGQKQTEHPMESQNEGKGKENSTEKGKI